MRVFDHSDPAWLGRYNRHGRTNGAFTYSRDIVRWHLPVWRNLLGRDTSIATCGKVPGATVQYLHERMHPDLDSLTRLFVTTYKDLADTLGPRGLWLPNTIDADDLPTASPSKGWVYFGNVIGEKRRGFEQLAHLNFDVVSGQQNQAASLKLVAQYRYGIGVGRCALEMMAMGLKVLIFGKSFGGLILSPADFDRQREANFNGNIITGAASLAEAVRRIDEAMPVTATFQATMPEIESRIVEAWKRVNA